MKEIIYYRESLIQSILADIYTFGCLIFSIWFSNGSKFWTFICFILFMIFAYSKTKTARKVFTNKAELKAYLEKEED